MTYPNKKNLFGKIEVDNIHILKMYSDKYSSPKGSINFKIDGNALLIIKGFSDFKYLYYLIKYLNLFHNSTSLNLTNSHNYLYSSGFYAYDFVVTKHNGGKAQIMYNKNR